MPRKRRAEPCGHPGRLEKGGCKVCHSKRTRAYHAAYRKEERRKAREQREADARTRQQRDAARNAADVIANIAGQLTPRQRYYLEKEKRLKAGKPVLKPYQSTHWETA